MSEAVDSAQVEWVTLEEAGNHSAIRQLIPNLRAWYWVLYKPDFKRRMVDAGALLKVGKSWRVSVVKAPAVIQEFYREASLVALQRAASKTKGKLRTEGARTTVAA